MCRLQLWMTINSCTKRSVIYSLSVLQPYYFFLYCKCADFCNVNKSLFNEYIWECLCCQDAKWIYSEYLEIHLVSEIFWRRTTIALYLFGLFGTAAFSQLYLLCQLKIKNFCCHLLTLLFQTHMTCFPPWNTKSEIWRLYWNHNE